MENKCNNSENRKQKKKMLLLTHTRPIVFYVIQWSSPSAYVSLLRTSTSTQWLVHSSHNTMIQTSALRKLTIS